MNRHIVVALLLTGLSACGGGTDPGATPAQGGPGASKGTWRGELPPQASPANMPAADSPEFFAAAAQEYAWSQGRGIDQQANLDYVAKTAPLVPPFIVADQTAPAADDPVFHDPYMTDWASTRGMVADTVIHNRYGAALNARLYGPKLPYTDPVTGATSNGPFPTIVFIPGFDADGPGTVNDYFAAYEVSLEQLAEHGYVVLAVSPQGEGGSEYFKSPSPYCDENGDWKKPQELGLTEQGPCAGQETPPPAYSGQYASIYNPLSQIRVGDTAVGDAVALTAQGYLDTQAAFADTATWYDGFRARFVFTAFDATDWLLSSANPWRDRVDAKRLGIAGHSAGADAAVVAGNGDRAHRFKAAVAWDTYGIPPDTVSPVTPTLLVRTELQTTLGPYAAPPHDEYFAAWRVSQRFLAEGRDVMSLMLRGSNHSEIAYVPYYLIDPYTEGPITNVSSKGGLVSLYYSIAWFDRWLKGADDAQQAANAKARLLARTFDDSADLTYHGQGTWDPMTQANAPYHLAGEEVATHLSFFQISQLNFDGVTCLDWQAGCP